MSLEARLRERIQREGPISFYEWMKAALYDQREGYYSVDRARQGRSGDYRTAPETSPLFAETFARYFAKLFRKLESPSRFTIVEVGSGLGDFAHGVLTTLGAEDPEVFAATNYLIEEISAAARARCAARLAEFSERVSLRSPLLTAHVEPAPSSRVKITGIIFSHELIDAFPVDRILLRDGKLRQLFVGIDDSSFVWIEDELEKPVAEYCERSALCLREGQVVEINLDAATFIARAADSLRAGYVISVDYGAERNDLLKDPNRHEGTLRTFHRHQLSGDLLARPGERDITSTIDWTQVREAGQQAGLRAIRFDRLDRFLIAEGLLDRMGETTRSASSGAEAARLTTGARELILPNGLAASFQVLVQEKLLAAI